MLPLALNPARRLRPYIALVVLVAMGGLAVLMATQSNSRLSAAYDDAGRTALAGIATTFDEGFNPSDLDRPAVLQERMKRLKASLPALHKISLSWAAPSGGTMLVQAGHEHDPTGAKIDVTTAKVVRGGNAAPFDAPDYAYHEFRAAQAHWARLEHPVGRTAAGTPLAILELHYDLKALDVARSSAQRDLVIIALLGALTVALLLGVLLTRRVLSPVDAIRGAANRIARGDREARLHWKREDELGDLARDFDSMADGLLEAEKDALTGALNHRAFQERLGQEIARAARESTPVAVVAMDIDDFKSINDVRGHAEGDSALRGLAQKVATCVRPFDVCGRVGGDEFMLALVGADVEEAERIVDRIREALTEDTTMTVSAGISLFPDHASDKEGLLSLADGAMYWAKSAGKNRTVVFSPDVDNALSPAEAAERNLHAGLVRTVHALARAVDAKDGYTSAHSHRVATYAIALGAATGMHPERLDQLRTAGVLHDVGKIGIADAILFKPGGLDEVEFAEMRRHSELGHDIIAGAGLEDVADWVLHLHERYDGGGYPAGVAGDDIPIESRILHCADALEAMTSSRVYRRGLPLDVALDELERGAGTQFDPILARLLVALVRSGEVVVSGDDAAIAPAIG